MSQGRHTTPFILKPVVYTTQSKTTGTPNVLTMFQNLEQKSVSNMQYQCRRMRQSKSFCCFYSLQDKSCSVAPSKCLWFSDLLLAAFFRHSTSVSYTSGERALFRLCALIPGMYLNITTWESSFMFLHLIKNSVYAGNSCYTSPWKREQVCLRHTYPQMHISCLWKTWPRPRTQTTDFPLALELFILTI